jgi:hypothetical protein
MLDFVISSVVIILIIAAPFLSLSMALQPFDPWSLFEFLIYTQSVGLLGRGSAHCKAATYTQNNKNTE